MSLLWKISHPDLATPSFLFGTMHVRDVRAFSFFEMAKTTLETCDVFAAEFNLDHTNYDALFEAVQLPEGKMQTDFLTPSIWKKTEKLVIKLGLAPPDFWKSKHPMLLLSAISEAFLKTESPVSLDDALFEHAKSVGKSLTGLETFEEQLTVFQKIPLDDSFKNLAAAVKNWGRLKRSLARTIEFYERGDLRQLYKSAKRSSHGLRSLLIYERNERMATRFAELAFEKTTFAAVGAGHLDGKKGMLRMLKTAGFSIEPVAIRNGKNCN